MDDLSEDPCPNQVSRTYEAQEAELLLLRTEADTRQLIRKCQRMSDKFYRAGHATHSYIPTPSPLSNPLRRLSIDNRSSPLRQQYPASLNIVETTTSYPDKLDSLPRNAIPRYAPRILHPPRQTPSPLVHRFNDTPVVLHKSAVPDTYPHHSISSRISQTDNGQTSRIRAPIDIRKGENRSEVDSWSNREKGGDLNDENESSLETRIRRAIPSREQKELPMSKGWLFEREFGVRDGRRKAKSVSHVARPTDIANGTPVLPVPKQRGDIGQASSSGREDLIDVAGCAQGSGRMVVSAQEFSIAKGKAPNNSLRLAKSPSRGRRLTKAEVRYLAQIAAKKLENGLQEGRNRV